MKPQQFKDIFSNYTVAHRAH